MRITIADKKITNSMNIPVIKDLVRIRIKTGILELKNNIPEIKIPIKTENQNIP